MTVQLDYALNEENKITPIHEASNTKKYYCPIPFCKRELIVKKGDVRAHHYAHKNIKLNHKPETLLHYNTKLLLLKYIQYFITQKQDLNILFNCSCGLSHDINILNNVDEIRCEKEAHEGYRPDLTLLNNNIPVLYIEIVVSHDVDKKNYQIIGDTPLIKIKPTNNLYKSLQYKFNKKNNYFYYFSEPDKHLEFKNIYGYQYCTSFGLCKTECKSCKFLYLDYTPFQRHSCKFVSGVISLTNTYKAASKQLKKPSKTRKDKEGEI